MFHFKNNWQFLPTQSVQIEYTNMAVVIETDCKMTSQQDPSHTKAIERCPGLYCSRSCCSIIGLFLRLAVSYLIPLSVGYVLQTCFFCYVICSRIFDSFLNSYVTLKNLEFSQTWLPLLIAREIVIRLF